MNVLACPGSLRVGGSAINAIDLAARVRDLGHEVTVFSFPGPLEELVARRDLPFVPYTGPRDRFPPSPPVLRALSRVIRQRGIELVHAYERGMCLEAYYGAQLWQRVPMVATVFGMSVPPYMPRSVPLIVGTRSLQERVQGRRRGRVELMEPPIDTDSDSPSFDGAAFVEEFGLGDDALNVVVVSRLEPVMKLDGLVRAMDAVRRLAREMPVRLVIVGTGPSAPDLERGAEAANRDVGRRAVVLTGLMLDPRPAYAAADIVLGMGSSVLRGMAFEKPAIVVGKGGFSEVVGTQTVERFLLDGFYGTDGGGDDERLYQQIRRLAADAAERRDLGLFSRQLVCERFSLKATAERLEAMYLGLAGGEVSRVRLLPEAVSVGGRVLSFRAKQFRRRRGRAGR